MCHDVDKDRKRMIVRKCEGSIKCVSKYANCSRYRSKGE